MAHEASKLVLFYSPWSRAVATRWLLEELGVDYEIRVVNPQAVPESYRQIQPHKKVPAVRCGSLVITERAAIAIYLADKFQKAKLAPTLDDPMRAAYLTSLVYTDAVFDPCVTANVRGLNQKGTDYSFGAYDDMLRNLEKRLTDHPFAAGDRFTAADTQLGSALQFTIHVLKAVPNLPAFESYLARVTIRPAHQRASQLDAELSARLLPNQDTSAVAQATQG